MSDKYTSGLCRKARSGKLKRFRGIDAPYEAANSPDLVLDTTALCIPQSVDALVKVMTEKGLISERVGLSCDS
ncbi:adenylyl-sulfate kinase [Simiduia aestuariiviva]|uniref:adenylyl-sulfate kinase n=1 Tax=Simiduia aestuariiviva TaxID=1510459 RepID=UPI0016139E02